MPTRIIFINFLTHVWVFSEKSYICNPNTRGISSVGRALAWHARGQEFESPMLHKKQELTQVPVFLFVV